MIWLKKKKSGALDSRKHMKVTDGKQIVVRIVAVHTPGQSAAVVSQPV